MKSILPQILIILFSGIIVFASGGFNLIHHYCGCTEDDNISILVEKSCCSDEEDIYNCDIDSASEPASCCQNEAPLNQTKHNHCDEGGDCCSSEYLYFKTDNFDLSGNSRVNFVFIVAYVAEIQNNQNQAQQAEFLIYQISNNLPPPEYGKELLYSIHQLKIATPLA